ncbi:MAG: YIP1 family protein [Paracoccaceae bacterium]
MDLSLNGLTQAAIHTVKDPKAGARMVLSLDLTRRQRWDMLLLTVVFSAILAKLSVLMSGGEGSDVGVFAASPFTLGFVQLILMLFAVFAVHFVGRRLGGTGDFDGAIIIVAWLQFVMICLQLVQLALLLISPFLAFLVGVAGLVLFFWMLTQFIMELHGFKSATAVFLGIFLGLFAFAIVLSILIGMSGVEVPGVSHV